MDLHGIDGINFNGIDYPKNPSTLSSVYSVQTVNHLVKTYFKSCDNMVKSTPTPHPTQLYFNNHTLHRSLVVFCVMFYEILSSL